MKIAGAPQDFTDGPCLQQLYRSFEHKRAELINAGASPGYAYVEAIRLCQRMTTIWIGRVASLANQNHPDDFDISET